jgi:hypothetical protein
MSKVFSVFYRTSEGKNGAISERKKGRSDSAPAPAIFVTRSTPLHSAPELEQAPKSGRSGAGAAHLWVQNTVLKPQSIS